MNKSIAQIFSIAKKDSRVILGLMSGTSMDGLDAALCKVTGSGISTAIAVLEFESVRYEKEYWENLSAVAFKKKVDLEMLCRLNEWVGNEHGKIVNRLLKKWQVPSNEIDLIASHGQTVYHIPQHEAGESRNGTLQIGDGDQLARTTGIITVSDFRQRQIAAGGEGAPLAAYGDFILFRNSNSPAVLLNIGGIANFTFIDKGKSFSDIICSDTGPGNILMDSWVRKHYPGMNYDENGQLAKQGQINETLLRYLKDDDFFVKPFPKTTGPEKFNVYYIEKALAQGNIENLPSADVISTLNKFTADTISEALQLLPQPCNCRIYASGGGVHNAVLMQHLKSLGNASGLYNIRENNIDPDAKEAVLFALLANECIAGNAADTFGKGSKNFPSTSMGKICFPE